MARWNHKNQFIQVYDRGAQLRLLRVVSENSEFGAVANHVVGDVAAERAPDGDSDHGMKATEFSQHWQQVQRGKFIGGDGELALLQLSEFYQGFVRVPAQI